tara:strand:- start:3483 stop:4373 length:891 start_codon:yes stop_codon:yes gene_type:complete
MNKFKKLINKIFRIFGLKISYIKEINDVKNNNKSLNNEKIRLKNYIKELLNEEIQKGQIHDILSKLSDDEFSTPRYIEALKELIKYDKKNTIFDVGAHKGETLSIFKQYFPNSKIYSFEPFENSYQELKKTSLLLENTEAFNIGLSNFKGREKFYSYIDDGDPNLSVINSSTKLIDGAMESFGYKTPKKIQTVECEFDTIDEFVKNHDIKAIDILKIDVQGSEYKVLEGADSIISSGKVKVIYLEILVVNQYDEQKSFNHYLNFFEQKKYDLFGIYNFSYQNNSKILQFDAIFNKL